MHLDIVVKDLEEAVEQAIEGGAVREGDTILAAYGKLAMFAEPVGHGFCLIQFNEQGYGAIRSTAEVPDP